MFADNLKTIQERIDAALLRAGRKPGDARLLAVSKTFGPEAVAEALQAGQNAFGENKVQEALDKIERVPDDRIEWHFIGHLQKNKVKYIPGRFALVHSIDSLSLALKLDAECVKHGSVTPVLIQVNVSGEASKFGAAPESVGETLKGVRDCRGIRVEGLMTLPPFDPDAEKARPHFKRLRELRDTLNAELGLDLKHLSMGMSHDFEVAVEEGATWVRVGTALFGARE